MERKEDSQSERRVIQLNQTFRPFDPTENILKRGDGINLHPKTIVSPLCLVLEEVFPFDIELSPSIAMKGLCITPFNPKIGYQIDSEDLNQENRRKKQNAS